MSGLYRKLTTVYAPNHPGANRLWWATMPSTCGPGCPHSFYGKPERCSQCLHAPFTVVDSPVKEIIAGLSLTSKITKTDSINSAVIRRQF